MDACQPTKLIEASEAGKERAHAKSLSASRYVLKTVLAQGGLGEIWLAEDVELQRDVALKVVQNRWLHRRGVEEQFRFEAIITGRLEHPGVVPVYDMGRLPNGRLFYCMKIIRGETFHAALRAFSALPEGNDRDAARRRLYGAFVSLCQTIAFAHSRGVIHLDLKPENVLLGEYGETQVLDWGLAKLLMGDVDPSCQRPIQGPAGTPGFMAPEQVDGEEAELSPRTDIFTLGVILAQIGLTELGRRLPKATFGDVDGFAVELHRCLRSLPGPLRDICLKAISRKPASRYQDARELASEVERYLGGDRVLAHREGPIVRFARLARKHRAKWLPIGIGLAVAVTAGALWWTGERNRYQSSVQYAWEQRQAAVSAAADGRVVAGVDALDDAADRLQSDAVADDLLQIIDRERTLLRAAGAFEDALEKARYLSADPNRRKEALEQCRLAERNKEFALPPEYQSSHYDRDRSEMHAELDLLKRLLEGADDAVATAPDSTIHLGYALYLNGRRYQLAGNWQAALSVYDEYLTSRPGDFWATYFRASCELQLGAAQEAVRDYTSCLDLKRELPLTGSLSFVYVNRGNAYLQMDATLLALADYERAAAADAETPALLHNHARALIKSGDTHAAMEKLDRALDLDPDFAPSLQTRAQLHRAAGRRQQARADLDRWLQAQPNSTTALVARALLACDERDFESAMRDARAAAREDPSLSIVFWVEGLMHAASDQPEDWPKSAHAYQQALDLEPKNVQVRNNLAEVMIRLGQFEAARRHLDEAVLLKPNYSLARFNRALALIGLRETEQAIADLDAVPVAFQPETALRRADRFSQIAMHAGRVLDVKSAASVIDACVRRLASTVGRFDTSFADRLRAVDSVRQLTADPSIARRVFGK